MSTRDYPLSTEPFKTTRLSDGRPVHVRWGLIEVTGRNQEPGMLWGTWYKVACRLVETGETFTQNLSYANWVEASVGSKVYVLFEHYGQGWTLAIDSYDKVPASPHSGSA